MKKAWFETWFDTHYYHLLYRNRNEVEARQFIDALLLFLQPETGASCIDVACGKGRHSLYLQEKGYMVTGIDLSANSISIAQTASAEKNNIQFIQHDIRKPFPVNHQNLALNLFTSFGYFDNEAEHLIALENIHQCLTPGGYFVIDYLNTAEVINALRKTDEHHIDGVHFEIQRFFDEPNIVKSISVKDQEQVFHFEERVRSFSKNDLSRLIEAVGFKIIKTFGNYNLLPFGEESPRVIIVAQKLA